MKNQMINPLLPTYEYIPDGEPYVFGERLYVYGSHDKFSGEAFCMNDYVCWSAPTDDLSAWRYEGVIYRKDQDPRWEEGHYLYAPDITPGPDGRYYLYYTLDTTGTMAVAVADSPTGPFSYYGRVRYPDGRIWGDDPHDVLQFDPGVLFDEDGRVWLYTGFGHKGPPEVTKRRFGDRLVDGAFCVELEQDMLTMKSEPVCLIPQFNKAAGTPYEAHPFFEASSIRKVDGVYYFIYSSAWGHELCYATSRFPDRDFQPGGVIISNGDIGFDGWTMEHSANYYGNNHGGMVQVKGQWYIFYHRQTNYHSFSRQCCVEKISLEEDGSIRQVEMTSCGIGGILPGEGWYSAAHACQLYAAGGACSTDAAGRNRQAHPAFTQSGCDREGQADQYITNMRNGSMAGFKYFDLRSTAAIAVQARGGHGKMLVWDRPGGTLLAEVPLDAQAPVPLAGGQAHSALYLEAVTEGSVDLIGFELFGKKDE